MSTTRRQVLLVVVVLLLAGSAVGVALGRDGGDDRAGSPAGLLTVTWGGADGGPGCTYDPASSTVEATLLVSGSPPGGDEPVLTVTAYADENTSRPVGSTSRGLGAATPSPLVLTIAVDRPPHVDEDGVAACSMAVDD